jgi:hypothetical protein
MSSILMLSNCGAIVASILSFVFCMNQMRQLKKPPVADRRRESWRYIGAMILLTLLLFGLSVSLKYDIDTLEQSGSFKDYPVGEHSIYYPVPYARPPYLNLVRQPSYFAVSPELIEQRPDGFRVRLTDKYTADYFSWKATGLKKRLDQ